MRHPIVRPALEKHRDQFIDWSIRTPNNLYDPDVVSYPSTQIWRAFDGEGAVAYMPIQQPLFMEWLAINPEADKIRVAGALRALTQNTITQAFIRGAGEIYFVCDERTTQEFASNQLFKEMPWKLFRIKLSDLEHE